MTDVTITLSVALKSALEDRRNAHGHASLNATIMDIIDNPTDQTRSLSGDEDVLTEPIAVSEFTRHVLRQVRDHGEYTDYEAVIRARGGYEPRDLGEQPIEVATLGD